MNEIITVNHAEALQAINRSEIDVQIATAKAYPRDLQKVLNNIETLATLDTDTAADCFYVLPSRGNGSIIEGPSVRMAEIIAGAWGNMRIQTRIVGNDGKTITAQAVCHDLETNLAVSLEVKRRITDRNGRTFSEDMQVTTGNAASSIAFRNAVLKVVPKALTHRVQEEVKRVAMGQAMDLETTRAKMINYFAKLGVTSAQLLGYLGVNKVEEIDKAAVYELRGIANAIKEGTTTVQETFIQPAIEAAESEKAQKAVDSAKAAANKALEAAKAATAAKAKAAKTKKEAKTAPEIFPEAGEGSK